MDIYTGKYEALSKTDQKSNYHHGDLKDALLASAELELEENGVEKFSLRGVAKRAGVSHAAPKHHFKDINGLLTALATKGYERFLETQIALQETAKSDSHSQLLAAGKGYINFALNHPALFRLMFSSNRPVYDDPKLKSAANAAFNHLVEGVKNLDGKTHKTDNVIMSDVTATWAMVHGLADLMTAGRVKYLLGLKPKDRDKMISEILCKVY